MARIRSIHPDICTSESMALLPAEVERTYCRLWTHCDDSGRCVDNVKLIKAAIFPLHDDVTCEVLDEHLTRLVAGRHLVGYEVAGRAYLQVREWSRYQHPQKARESKLPVRDSYAKPTRGVVELEVESKGLEGRGDWIDTSAKPTDESSPVPNPTRLAEVTRGLKAIG